MKQVTFITSLGISVRVEWNDHTGRLVWSSGKATDFMERKELARSIRFFRNLHDISRSKIKKGT